MLHDKGIQCKEIANHPSVKELELNLLNCTTSGYGLTGEGESSALLERASLRLYLCPALTKVMKCTISSSIYCHRVTLT